MYACQRHTNISGPQLFFFKRQITCLEYCVFHVLEQELFFYTVEWGMAYHAHACFNLAPVFNMWTLLGDLAWRGQHVSYACQWHTRACVGFNLLLKGTVAWGGPPAQSAPHDAARENLRYPDPYYCYRRHAPPRLLAHKENTPRAFLVLSWSHILSMYFPNAFKYFPRILRQFLCCK